MPLKKKYKKRNMLAQETVVVVKTKMPAKAAPSSKLAKANRMLSKTKWID
jgi:hypothetical protein